MASDSLSAAPYPHGPVIVRIGGYVPNGMNVASFILDAFKLPWNCYVARVDYTYHGGTADLDAVTLDTATGGLDLVATADMAANILAVKQTLHADIVGEELDAGEVIQIAADSQGANEAGWLMATLYLEPSATRPKPTTR